jgi:hypothetical protein
MRGSIATCLELNLASGCSRARRSPTRERARLAHENTAIILTLLFFIIGVVMIGSGIINLSM